MSRKSRLTRLFTIALTGLGLSFAAGCAGKKHLSPQFGDAQRSTHTLMIVDPSAGSQPSPEGLNSRSAEHALDNYSKGQKAQEHPRKKGSRGAAIQINNN